jgi:16S rRNA processing protein RimM
MPNPRRKKQTRTEPRFLVVGQILRPHGIRGEVRVQVITAYPERLLQLDSVGLSHNPEGEVSDIREIERVRLHQGQAIFKINDCDDRDTAELLRGQYVLVAMEDAVPLEEDEYYHFQLIGLKMMTEDQTDLGEVVEILETGANDVYVVRSPHYGELLIPAIESVVKDINIMERCITIVLMPGLLPDVSDNA